MSRSAGAICFVIAVGVLGAATATHARPVPAVTYPQLTRDYLVVIATPVGQRELPERTVLPGVSRAGKPIPAVQVETTFEVVTLFRGDPPPQGRFVLLHFREAATPPERSPNRPLLVRFQPGSGAQYLMFLRREPDGRYTATTGQTDPGLSIERLQQMTSPNKE